MDNFKVLFIYPNNMMATTIPLSLSQLAGVLKEKNIEIRLFDTTFYPTEKKSFEDIRVELLQIKPFDLSKSGVNYKDTDIFQDLRDLINEYAPDLIAISLVEDTAELGFALLQAIKDFDIPVVAGGVYVTVNPHEVIENANTDMICIGEGEGALLELCNNLKEEIPIKDIRNLWVKDNGGVHTNSMRPLVNLDENYYMDFSIWEQARLAKPMYGRNYTTIQVEIERGCPFSCAYCNAPELRKIYQEEGYNNYYRRKSYEKVIQEIKHYIRLFKVDYIYFNAESFLSRPLDAFEKFAEVYSKEIGLPFRCQTRVENITEEKIRILKDMGCDAMQFGIESGNESLRNDVLLRKHSNELIIKALKIVEKFAIPYTANNIIGFPLETKGRIFDTIMLNRQVNPRTVNCFMFTPYKGTVLYRYCIENGYLEPGVKTHQCLDGCEMKNLPLSKEELKGIQRVFPIYCRFPEYRFNEIKVAEQFNDEGNAMFKKLSKEYTEKYFY